MILPMREQGLVFLMICGMGFVFGGIYDLLRTLFRFLKFMGLLSIVWDFLYWVFAAFFLFTVMLGINYGEIRIYMVLGFIGGMTVYYKTLSEFFVRYIEKALYIIKRIVLFFIRLVMIPVVLCLRPTKSLIKICKRLLKKIVKCGIIKLCIVSRSFRGRSIWREKETKELKAIQKKQKKEKKKDRRKDKRNR